jgi:hypothetical protein
MRPLRALDAIGGHLAVVGPLSEATIVHSSRRADAVDRGGHRTCLYKGRYCAGHCIQTSIVLAMWQRPCTTTILVSNSPGRYAREKEKAGGDRGRTNPSVAAGV